MKLPLLLTVAFLLNLMATSVTAQQPNTLRHNIPAPPTGAQTGAQLGWSVAVDGSYTVVGAPFDDLGGQDTGVVKVFDTVTGALLHILTNPAQVARDSFGNSVAVSGNRVVVGAYNDDTAAVNAGRVYVYDLSTAAPTTPILTIDNPTPAPNDDFGNSVAIFSTQVVVGADGDDTGATDAGSAYVYDVTSATPTAPALTLNNPAPTAGDNFGRSVSISSTRVVIGASGDDAGADDAGSAYVYDLTSATPHVPAATLNNPSPAIGDGFGISVAISGPRVVVGAYLDGTGAADTGSAYVYDVTSATPSDPIHTWNNPTLAASALFGQSVAISGDRVVVGAYGEGIGAGNAGSAYVYDLTSTTPAVPAQILNNPFPAEGDLFGNSVAISGTRVLIGASSDDAGANDAGSAYVYDLASATPSVPALSINNPGPAAFGNFGFAVSVSGTRVVIGAVSEDAGGTNAGSAYVYDLASGAPTVPIYALNNPNPGDDDNFGNSVAISGPRVVVGAPGDDTGAIDAGSAYVYDLAGSSPTFPVATFSNPGPTEGDGFGISVAISGTVVVVGASGDDTGATDAGSAYAYDLASAAPTVPVATLNNPDPAADDGFGMSVAISGTRVVVGAPGDDTGATDAGSAYAYDLASATPTVSMATLHNPAPASGDGFGISVAISASRVVVGAYGDDTGATDSGSAYIYELAGPTPSVPATTLHNPGPATGDGFGIAVAISGTRIIVGASKDNAGATDAGSAYLYDLTSATPALPVDTLGNPGTTPIGGDGFGYSVALDGTTAVIGAPFDDSPQFDKGSASVFGPGDTTGPTGGNMTLAPASPVDGAAALGVTFAGWTDPSPPLSYQLLLDNVPVAPAGPGPTVNLTSPTAAGPHSLKGRITDGLGNVTEVTQSFAVLTAQQSWRRTYFGNPDNIGTGADTEDPDRDGQVNLFEYVAGLIPTDASSHLALRVDHVVGQPDQKAIIFSPIVVGRTYMVKSKASLADPTWTALGSFNTTDNGSERTVIDLDAGTGPKFYIIEITLP